MKARIAAPLALTAALALSACETAPPPTTPAPSLSYVDQGPIALNVRNVEFIDGYVSPLADPNVEHLFPITPADAVRRWAADRLAAQGSAGRARVIVHDARVIETKLPTQGGVVGYFTTEPAARYEARIEVEIQAENPQGDTGATRAAVTRTTTVPEGATLTERDRVWFELVRDAMAELDARLEQGLTSYLTNFTI